MRTLINKKNVITSLLWKFLEQSGTQGIQFIVQIILARLLLPEDYGLIALVMIFITLANVFIQSGFGAALIQKKQVDELDYSSAFYFSLGIAIILYTVIYIMSGEIADFYNEPRLIKVLRVLSISVFFGAINAIQYAFISKNLLFKKLFVSSLLGILISGIGGIFSAYQGLGVWAIVIQHLLNQLIVCVSLLLIIKWRPRLIFSWARVKLLFDFGGKLLISSLIDTLYLDLRSLIIGKIYMADVLGFYKRGSQFPQFIVNNINGSIQSVLLPTLSAFQDDIATVRKMVRTSIITSSYIVFPMMMGLAVTARPIILILLTDKWLRSVPYMQIFCAVFALMPLHTTNLQCINALGRSDIFLKIEIVKKTLGLIVLFVTLAFGPYAIAFGVLFIGIVSTFINAFPNKRLLNYTYKEQLVDVLPSFMLSVIMGSLVYLISFLDFNNLHLLIIQVVVGLIAYIGLSSVLHIKGFEYLVSTIKDNIKGKKQNGI